MLHSSRTEHSLVTGVEQGKAGSARCWREEHCTGSRDMASSIHLFIQHVLRSPMGSQTRSADEQVLALPEGGAP